jgi:AcrR family transcriptional regulator
MRRLSQAERVELSDRRMIKTAIQLIIQQGINGMKLTDVGLRCGYSRGLAAMRFGTKAALLSRVARHALAGWIERVTQATATKVGLQAVLAAIDTQSRWMTEAPEEMRALYLIFFHSADPSAEYHLNVGNTLAAQRRDLARWIHEAREAGEVGLDIGPAEEAEQILSSLLGIVYQSIVDRNLPAGRLHAKLKSNLRKRLSAPLQHRSARAQRRTAA